MRKIMKRMLAVILSVTLLVPCMESIIQAAEGTSKNYILASTANPNGQYSLEYFDTSDYSFKRMPNFINNQYWAVEDSNGTLIKGYTQQATGEEYAVVRFTAPNKGEAQLYNSRTENIASRHETNLGFAEGEIIIVQKSAEGYSPLWPSAGSWGWSTIPQKTSSSDTTTKMEWPSELKTYVEQGDEILFIIRAKGADKRVSTNIGYKVTLTERAQDTSSLRPTTWDSYFKGADDKLTTSGEMGSSWYVTNTNNTSNFTAEYIDSTSGYQKMDTYVSDSSYWTASKDSTLKVGPYYMVAGVNRYSATVFNATSDGYVNWKNRYAISSSTSDSYDEAEVMIVQSGASGYYPLWPNRGTWEWKSIPRGDSNGIAIELDAYLKSGEKLAIITRSKNSSDDTALTWLKSDCIAKVTTFGNDYRGLYPSASDWSSCFEGYTWRAPLGGWTEHRESWYINNSFNAEGSNNKYYTAEYNAGSGFVPMENLITASPNYWQTANGAALIKPYMQTATASTYSAVVFHTQGEGYLKISNVYDLYTQYSSSGTNEPAQVMLVQGSEEKGYAPIWPVKGSWEYKTLPMRTSASDTTGMDMGEIYTYVKSGEKIYFVVRSGFTATGSTSIQSELRVHYLAATADESGSYPTVWSQNFDGYSEARWEIETDLATVSINSSDGQIRKLEKYRPVFLDTDRANPIFKNIPEPLIGKSFVCTYCWDGTNVGWTKEATAESDGWVYAFVTNAKASKVKADGWQYVAVDVQDLFTAMNSSDACKLYKRYVNKGDKITIYDRWMVLMFDTLNNENEYEKSDSFVPPVIVFSDDAKATNYAKADRKWQGCAAIGQTSEQVLYTAWVTGGEHEVAAGNYIVVVRSLDGGDTWEEYMYLVSDENAPNNKTADLTIFVAPNGSLWIFFLSTRHGNSYNGVWAVHTDNPNDANPTWSEPQWICPASINTQVTVLSDGTWIMGTMALYDDVDYTDVWASEDEGTTWTLRGQAYMPETYVDEVCIVELQDGRLWMTVRSTTENGIVESYSSDGGRTWTTGTDAETLNGPGSKFAVIRLKSGNLLQVNHYEYTGRDHMTALLSTDDGKTWTYALLLDERTTSYPHVTTWNYNGEEVITVAYDHERYDARQIYTATFTEDDIIAGTFTSQYAREKYLIDSLSGDALFDYNNSWFVQQDTNPYTWGYCTYGYFNGNEFKTMEKYIPANGSDAAHWQSESGESSVTTWRVFGTENESPTISFFIGKSGYLEISEDAVNPLQTNGVNGKFMIVQVNGDGEYCPLYPKAGEWTWQDISTTPTDIGTIRTYMNSDDKVFLIWKTADGSEIAVETMAHFKFVYASTDIEDIYKDYTWTRWLGGGALETNQTSADEISAKMKALEGITLDDAKEIKAVRNAYESLTETQKSLTEGLEYLTAAEQKIANLEKQVDCVKYLEDMMDVLPDELNEDSLESYKEVVAAYQMLTEKEKTELASQEAFETVTKKLSDYLVSKVKVNKVEKLIDSIPLPYDLMKRAALEKAYGAFKELKAEEQEMVENVELLQALRRITSLKDSGQNLVTTGVGIINALPTDTQLTLNDEYDVMYAFGFYSALTESEQNNISNYEKLQNAVNKLEQLKADAKGTYYTITAEATENGTIVSSGVNKYHEDRKVVYQIIPFVDCDLVDVLVDGVSVGPVSTYVFDGLDKDHTISAVFSKRMVEEEDNKFNITLVVGKGGTVTVVKGDYEAGSDITYSIKANEGYVIEDVIVDGQSIGKTTSYTFTELRGDHTLEAKFRQIAVIEDEKDEGDKDKNQDDTKQEGKEEKETTSPGTGDFAYPMTWTLLLFACVLVISFYSKKRKDNREA